MATNCPRRCTEVALLGMPAITEVGEATALTWAAAAAASVPGGAAGVSYREQRQVAVLSAGVQIAEAADWRIRDPATTSQSADGITAQRGARRGR